MLTKSDIKTLKKTFSTKEELRKNSDRIIKELTDYINIGFEKLSEIITRLDKLDTKLNHHRGIVDNHERRIEKIEEKVFTTVAS